MRTAFSPRIWQSLLGWLALPLASGTQAPYPTLLKGNYALPNFKFIDGETLPVLSLHYTTVGQPHRNSRGRVMNAVLLMHSTTGTSANFLTDFFAGHLFGPGQPLDAAKYYVILPDAIGHGQSRKPSNGLRMKFPKYTYDDMVVATHRLLTEKLGMAHARLVMGTSMGGTETWENCSP